MESRYYSVKDIVQITGYKESKSYDIIKELNTELETINKDKPIEEKYLILPGRILKSYFDKKLGLRE